MNMKVHLSKFVDAVISENATEEKLSFKNFCEAKFKSVLGIKQEFPLTEDFRKSVTAALTEAQLTDDIEIDGSDNVFVRGKRVGKLGYSGTDETGNGADLYFLSTDGKKFFIKDNEIEDLVQILTNRYLGKDNEIATANRKH